MALVTYFLFHYLRPTCPGFAAHQVELNVVTTEDLRDEAGTAAARRRLRVDVRVDVGGLATVDAAGAELHRSRPNRAAVGLL